MSKSSDRLYLSPPSATEDDIAAVVESMRSGWLAPTGPDLAAFESDIANYLGASHAVGLASGTSAIHLALRYVGVGPGDSVIVPTMTFAATVFPIVYLGASPVFLDVDDSWNLDPNLLRQAITGIASSGSRVAAIIPVDLYGTPADYTSIRSAIDTLDVCLVEDAAEGLGGSGPDERKLGTFGEAGVLSFNGNKIITTAGGGMLVTDNSELAAKTRFWATQARERSPWYEHREVGHNYRLSNLLAALGRSQLRRIDGEVAKRRQIREWYRSRLSVVDGILVQNDPSWGRSNAWLSVVRFDPDRYHDAARCVRERLAASRIESRPVWKPMHRQPVFASARSFLSGAADALFRDGLCLPSGTSLDEEDVDRVCSLVLEALGV